MGWTHKRGISGAKIKLGGGQKIKQPIWNDPAKERQFAPVVNDGQVPNI